MELRRSLGLNFVPSAKETDGRLDFAMLEVRGIPKACDMSSVLKLDGSRKKLHLEFSSWSSPPATVRTSEREQKRK